MAVHPYLGEIMLIAAKNPPQGWLLANGQELRIIDHTHLFAMIGTQFGGDGFRTFVLPNMDAVMPAADGMIWCIAVQGDVPVA